MKKVKLNKKLFLNKDVVSNLGQNQLVGGEFTWDLETECACESRLQGACVNTALYCPELASQLQGACFNMPLPAIEQAPPPRAAPSSPSVCWCVAAVE